MRTMPTDMIELTRKEGDALWWACDAFFDFCTKLLESDEPELDPDLLGALVWAGNALRESLKSAGVDRAIERFPRSDIGCVRRILGATIDMDDEFLQLPFDPDQWTSRVQWEQACEQTSRTTTILGELMKQIRELEAN
ncbi:MAG: hypothetical protein CMJ24_01900 [Phycisphaerae bacterium]|nr:hypothetical protein [Phycisphaerae bacterium]